MNATTSEQWKVCWTTSNPDVVMTVVYPSKAMAEHAHDVKMRHNIAATVWIEPFKTA